MTQTPGTPDSQGGHPTSPDAWREQYAAQLAAAVEALTAAARLGRPRMQEVEPGEWVEDVMDPTEQTDWAEFVTLALAGAAANFGGVEAILAGRSGSWEASGVRQLLHSTVGEDESGLWAHRTEPLAITLYVDEILGERTQAWSDYLAAGDELRRRIAAADAAEPEIDEDRYLWFYDRNDAGEWAPRSPEAPPWSREAWLHGLLGDGIDVDLAADIAARLDEAAAGVYIAKSPEAEAELTRLQDERDARVGTDLEEHLEEQRIAEWTAYGEALKTRIETNARTIPELDVPVMVTVDIDTVRRPAPSLVEEISLESRLIDTAVMDTPAPDDLEGTPLERLQIIEEGL